MIVQTEFLSKLKDFGLNSYEAKLWTALLSRGVSTAGELSDIANVPRSRSYDVLESLEKKGFIVMKLGKPIKYIAVPPEEVVERVKKQIHEDASRQTKQLDSLLSSDVIEELNALHTQGIDLVDPTELTGAIKGRNNLYNHLESQIRNAKKTVTILTTEQGLHRKVDYLKGALKKAKSRGVTIRIAAPLTASSKDMIESLRGIAQVKRIDSIQARFVVCDSRESTFMLLHDKNTHPTYDVGVWVHTPYFSTALDGMFDSVWKEGKNLL